MPSGESGGVPRGEPALISGDAVLLFSGEDIVLERIVRSRGEG